VVADLYQKRVFLDTAPLIYFIEGHSTYQDKLVKFLTSNDNGDFTFITSSIALLEILVKPLKEGKSKLVTQYKKYF